MNNYKNISDECLCTLYNDGDEHSLEVILERYKPLVKSISNKYSIYPIDRDDIAQEAIIAIFKSVKTYDKDSNCKFAAYVDICTNRRVLNYLKASNRKKHSPLNNYLSLDDEDNNISIKTNRNNPEKMMIIKENISEINKCISTELSDMERKVLLLYFEDFSYSEIAKKLSITEKSVDNSIQRIRKKMLYYKNKMNI